MGKQYLCGAYGVIHNDEGGIITESPIDLFARKLRAYIAEGSGVQNHYVIPGYGSGPEPLDPS